MTQEKLNWKCQIKILLVISVAMGLSYAGAYSQDFDYDLTAQKVADQQHYGQRLRPQFHYTPIQGHIGDATGMLYYKGEYHLFYMFDKWELRRNRHKRWGHAVSSDMVHWTELAPELDTLLDHKPGSGSGVVDWNNSAKLQRGHEKTLLIFYTDYERGSCIAYSHDRGHSWTRYGGNPVLDGFDGIRDPTVFWYQPTQNWRMIRYEKRGFVFYTSDNLIDWTYLSRLEGYYECPDIMELAVDDNKDETMWVLIDGNGRYVLGQFDGTTFIPETKKLKVEYGRAPYATQTWKKTRLAGGRPVQMCWMNYPRNEKTQKLTWNGHQPFPCELFLKKFEDGVKLCRRPIDEIKNLHRRQYIFNNMTINEEDNPLKELKADICEIIIDIKVASANRFKLEVGAANIEYDVAQQKLTCLQSTAPLAPINGYIHLQVLIDRSSVEVFGNGGRVSISDLFFPDADSPDNMRFSVQGGSAHIKTIEVNYLESIWGPLVTKN